MGVIVWPVCVVVHWQLHVFQMGSAAHRWQLIVILIIVSPRRCVERGVHASEDIRSVVLLEFDFDVQLH